MRETVSGGGMGDQHPRVTLEDVALAAGVSKATASKVLNGRPNVDPRTRRRVEETIIALGYVPSTGPREAQADTSVDVVFDSMVSMYSLQVLNGILTAARDLGVEVVVDVLDQAGGSGTPLSDAWLMRSAARRRLGVIVVSLALTAGQVRTVEELGLPLVSVDLTGPLGAGLASVASTNFAGGTQATEHLLALGHRRIGFAGLPAQIAASRERLHGYRNALELAGVEADPSLVVHGGFSAEAGCRMALELLRLPDPPTAIFAACDGTAFGVFEAARRLGRRVPQELSIVGFDDVEPAKLSSPPLTTVHQPIADMGRVAMRTLHTMARGGVPDSLHIQLATHLVVRESTAPPPGGQCPGTPPVS
ncbi:substrate-binding domain-containing protein [Dactylosporangium sp. NPDC051484]|uniref:LacI family DNA-binding transcriptional regulator n=1 Tax=Dactylosporangium sp. NPDC051484 TaxID=3154942 RepID=UPI0034503492